jgi:hypothetical protein
VTLQESSDELIGIEVLYLVDDEAFPSGHPPAPDEEDLERGLQLVLRETDHIHLDLLRRHHLLLLDRFANVVQLVAVLRSNLVLLTGGCVLHRLLEASDHRSRVPVEEIAQLHDDLSVVIGLDRLHARSGAPLDMEQQTRLPAPPGAVEDPLRAGPDGEGSEQEVQRVPDRVSVGERAVVADALSLLPP